MEQLIELSWSDLIDKRKFLNRKSDGRQFIDDCGRITNMDSTQLFSDNPLFNQFKSDFIFLKITLTVEINDLGAYQNFDFIQTENPTNSNISPIFRMIGVRKEKYFDNNVGIKHGFTDSKLENLVGFGGEYKTIKDIETSTFTGVINENNDETTYVENAFLQGNTYSVNTGVKYITNDEQTTFEFQSQSFNEQNTDLKELVFDEVYLGIQEIEDNTKIIQINRGDYNIFQQHLNLENVKF